MKMSKLGLAAILTGALALVAVPAQAGLTLKLDAGGANVVTINDLNNDGVVTWNGTVGGWSLNITSAISNSPGSAGESAWLDLTSVNRYTGGGVGTIKITASDDGWFAPQGVLTARTDVGGTLSNGSTASFVSKFNTLFSSTTIASLGPFTTSAFSASGSGSVNAPWYGYGLSGYAEISSLSGAPTSSFDLITTVPEPALLGLFGLGLLGLGFLRRRKAA